MNSLKEAQELVASFGETPTLDLSSASDDLDLSAAVDAPSVTPGKLLGAFAYTVRQTPGVLASTLKSYRSFQAKQFPTAATMDEPLDPFVADYKPDAGRTVFDEHFDRLPMEARIRASAKMEALTADGMPPTEAFKQATFDEIKESEKNLMNQLTAVEQATAMPKEYKESTGFLEDVARGMGTSVASMAGFMAGGPGLATAMAYAQMHGYKVQELEELGVTDPYQLLKGGMASGALQAPLEAIGSWAMLSRIMKANGTWTSWLLKTAEGAAGEGLTEFVQQYPDVYASLLALNPDVSQGDIFSHIQSNLGDITTDALYAFAVGAVAGGVTTGAGAGVHVGIDKLITTKQKAVNEERANRIDYLANKDELTPQDEGSLREMLNLAEDADVKAILKQVKKQFELEKPIESDKREAAKAFHEKQYGTEQAEANVAIMDALARSAAEKGWVKNPAEFYDKLTFEAVEGEQVDEAATEAGLFQTDLFQGQAKAPVWFSQMERMLASKLPGRADSKQMAQTVEAFAKKGEFKAEELEWSGLREWLASKDGKVSKDEVLAYLRENNVQVQEVVKGGNATWSPEFKRYMDVEYGLRPPSTPDEWIKFSERLEKQAKQWQRLGDDNQAERHFRLSEEAGRLAEGINPQTGSTAGQPVYGQYQTPGGENYRELLLTLPEKKDAIQNRDKLIEKYRKEYPESRATDDDILNFYVKNKDTTNPNFRSSHYQEPNILAHIRFNERTDADGKRVLFIEEVQSDWAQKGRKEGFNGKQFDVEKADSLQAEWEKHVDAGTNNTQEAQAILRELRAENNKRFGDSVPDAPFVKDTGKWSMLAMKRMVRYAAENGFDRIAWTTGEMQAERYDLSKQVAEIRWEALAGDKVKLNVTGLNRNETILDEEMLETKVDDYIGKELGDQIRKSIADGRYSGGFSGDGLKVGGEGMKGFYDKILPAEVNRFFGKAAWGNARVGQTEIPVMPTVTKQQLKIPGAMAEPTPVHSLDITPQMKAKAVSEGMSLFQGEEVPRGQITLKTNSIEALIKHFKAADASTTVHELGHFVTGMLWEQGDSDYLTLAEYAGVDSDAALAGLSGWTTEQHEKVAKAFETYLMEGKSPSQKLQQVFQRMKEWLIDIYRSIKALDVELTDEVRQVFDRLLTTEIERAENPLLEVREWFNVDEVTQRELARRADEAANMADLEYGDLVARAREMVITDKKKKKASAEKKLRAEMMKEATKSIEAEPFYEMLEDLIRNGGMKQSVVEGLYDKSLIKDIQSRRPGIIGKEGISPDVIGAEYGYDSIDDMIQDILQKPTKGEAIQTYFDGLWGEYQRYEHLSWAETYQEALEAELSIFEKITGKEGKPKPTKGIKKVIREATGIIKPEELKQLAEDLKRDSKVARDAWNAARKAMREETNEALSEAKRKAATKEKEKAIAKIQKLRLEHLERMQDLRDNFKEKQRIDKYTKAINKVLRQKHLLPDYRSQIAAFVSEYIDVPNKFRGDSPDVDFITFLDQHQETNEYLVDAIRAEYSNKPQQRRNAKGYRIPLKADEFEVVYRTVKMLGHMASLEDQIIKGTEKIQRGQIISGMVNRMFDVWGAPDAPVEPLDALEKKKRLAWYQKLSQAGKDYLAEIRKPEFIFDALDGWEANGPNAELFRDIKHASDKELTIGGQYLKDLRAIFKKHIGKKSVQWARKLHEVPGIALADPQTGKVSRLLSKEQMIMIALNSGNNGNLTALREGYNLDDAQIQAVYDALTDKEKALVDDIWKLIDTLYPKLNEVHKVLTGVSLPKVEGRYFPLAFDRELSWKAGGFAQKQMEKDLFSSAYTRPNVAAGHRITRTGGKMPPELSFGVIAKHLVQTIHDITHQVPVRNIQKIIADPEYRMAVSHAMGEPIYKQLMPWLHNIARPMGEPNSRVEKVISRIRRHSTVVELALKFSVAMLQPLAYTQTIDQVGMVQAVKALSQFYVDPRAAMRFINESSPTMANRKEVYDRELMQIRDSFDKGALGGSQAATNAFFALIDVTDAAFRYPTWLAGYNVEMDRSGDHEKSVDFADKVVAKTQGWGMPKDMAMLQRGGQQRSEMVKLLTMFYTFFSVFTNRFMDTTSKYRIGKISLSQAVVSYWWILVLPALIEGVVRKRDVPEDPWEALTGALGYLAAGFPLIRDVVNPILTGYRYSFTPAQRALELPGRISNAIKAKDKGDKGRRLAMEAMEVAGYIFGLPTRQAKITMDGIIDLMDGQTSDPSVLLFRRERQRGKTKPSM